MAGSHSRSPITAAEQAALPSSMSIATVTNHWEVQYARFIVCPASPHSSHSSLISLSSIGRKDGKRGKWISSASIVSLKLRTSSFDPNGGFILVVSLGDRILEEHYISRLMFSWPQVSCVSGFPARGSRAILVSYRDSVGQIQKFILRFLTIYEIENFMNVLKGKLDNANPQLIPCAEFDSAISSQSEFNPLDGASHRENKGWICAASGDSAPNYMPLNLAPEFSQDSHKEETKLSREADEILSAFPPSFTSFLTNCCPEIDQVAAQSSMTKEVDLKDQIAKYLEDSSFQDMLVKIEKVIHELGDNTVL
ncbi:protein POOR HOMOLOGOUS SYNAPSIS 1 isoform X2 [Solanum lycopersicum]|uniref:protein POOR HOMOLOGOUS SYNAPSIS 1 isoform X2 n=1 Tax=Solanum lycopersicum TaxID=4081 RepID=UPI000532ABCC|nr:protein POOR HOMOLOGOUS SYNAPSIS 1 [Solanum lycopersicum]